ncbi:MAG: tRNA 2-selenouridine(34) synthase MnmH [Gammaproteobacteria bacterium]|nr:tRNA 2-selenouridine(34) synthase MnmH [Gammaproteobacteria bacterium]
MELPEVDDYRSLFLDETALMDVRAPVEFQQGAFPHTLNLPLMNDDERHKVGLQYKEQGQDKAIELGHSLVSGDIKESRLAVWTKFVQNNPQGLLYCFRGGLRSRISQQWIYENTGVVYPRVKGGYKALRRFLIDELEAATNEIEPVILSGRTGIGKTLLLNRIQQKIDLEGIFHHRGSVFGKHADPQPSQIDIENSLSIELLKQRNKKITKLVIEDEGISIGSRRIPDVFFNRMKESSLIVLEASVEERVEITFDEYIIESLAEYQKLLGESEGFKTWAENLQNSFERIQKRLGGVRYKEYRTILNDAIKNQRDSGESGHHKVWIENLLTQYYDPMYDYQLSLKKERQIFRGDRDAVLAFLADEYGIAES